IWQAQHNFIYLDFVRAIHERDIRWHRTDGFWIEQLDANTGPLLLPLWFAGLLFLMLARSMRPYRVLAWIYVIALILFAMSRGRGYYVAPAYPMLLAAGAVAFQEWLDRLRAAPARALRVCAWGMLALACAGGAIVALPL